jgi:hypothetical protein
MYVIKLKKNTNSLHVKHVSHEVKLVHVGRRGLPGVDGVDGANGAPGAPGVVQSIVAGDNITIDSTDPAHPIVSATSSGVTKGFVIAMAVAL